MIAGSHVRLFYIILVLKAVVGRWGCGASGFRLRHCGLGRRIEHIRARRVYRRLLEGLSGV